MYSTLFRPLPQQIQDSEFISDASSGWTQRESSLEGINRSKIILQDDTKQSVQTLLATLKIQADHASYVFFLHYLGTVIRMTVQWNERYIEKAQHRR